MRLIGAIGSKEGVHPLGEGYQHIPADTPIGYTRVRTIYSPHLNCTVLCEDDVITSNPSLRLRDFTTAIYKYHSKGTCSLTMTHESKKHKSFSINGIISKGKCYTAPLIMPDLPASHPHATIYNSMEKALRDDSTFAKSCSDATANTVSQYQQRAHRYICNAIKHLPPAFHSLPLQTISKLNTPVLAIKARTERLLWHQRLGHPSDEYLYNAHKHIDGVPKFLHADPILDQCPTCIRAKQTKQAAGPNSTQIATIPFQGLSIDFAFSGMRSKNSHPSRPDPKSYIGKRIAKSFDSVLHFGTVTTYHPTTSPKTPPLWTIVYDDNDSEDLDDSELQRALTLFSKNNPESPQSHTHNASARAADYEGFNGETSWILITDHYTGKLLGKTCLSKATPMHWLRNFLDLHAPSCSNKYVHMDQGGELYRNPRLRHLFQQRGYDIRPTGADSSHQNGPVERAHRTVADMIRTLLSGANLPIKFWPYAFHHALRIINALPRKGQTKSRTELATGKKENLRKFKTFGSRVWIRPPGGRKSKLKPNARKGIFLGFIPNTTRNIIWFDEETHKIKSASHARFDEGMNDLPLTSLPPNVVHLQRTNDNIKIPMDVKDTTIDNFFFYASPFDETLVTSLTVSCKHPTFGLTLKEDEINGRTYVHHLIDKTSAAAMFSSYKAARRKLKGAYILAINKTPVFDLKSALDAIKTIRPNNIQTFPITFAVDRKLSSTRLHKDLDEFNIFAPDLTDSMKETGIDFLAIRAITRLRSNNDDLLIDDIPLDLLQQHLHAIQSQSITPAEQALGHFTRRKLQTLNNWPAWRDAERKQLDQFHDLEMFGAPIPRPKNAIVLRPHWQYSVRRSGERRSRNCCDGSKRAAPTLHALARTYSSCVEQPIQRLFLALAAIENNLLFSGDAKDAYAHSPPPDIPTFVSIDAAYADWYEWKFNKKIDRTHVLPVQHALQGHPESGRLWEEHINRILQSPELNFKSTTHDKCIYQTTFQGHKVMLLRQVDDFLIACKDQTIATAIFDIIGAKLKLPNEPIIPFKNLGLATDYNGVDLHQTQSYIQISCANYIDRVAKSHGWSNATKDEIQSHPTSPLPDDAVNQMFKATGPPEDSDEHAELESKHGFSYRTLLGELLYAYVTCRPDIGYATTTLSKFSSCPADVHYRFLKYVTTYLRRTRHWGIRYHRTDIHSHTDLPPGDYSDQPPPWPSNLPPFPELPSGPIFACLVDAAFGNVKTKRKSTTGYSIMLAGACIAYRSKTQTQTALSSTEAEFYAAVSVAKVARYLRSILQELGYPQTRPTLIYEDNQPTIKIVDSNVPTERSRHIEIPFFAIQDWRRDGFIEMTHIAGTINSSDVLTKPLAWVLHSRHARRLMGHYNPVHSFSPVICNQSIPDQGKVLSEGQDG